MAQFRKILEEQILPPMRNLENTHSGKPLETSPSSGKPSKISFKSKSNFNFGAGDSKRKTSVHVDAGRLGFFTTNTDKKSALTVIGSKNVEISPDEIITAPDGGWGWVIVFIAFISNMIVDGTIYSFALIQKEITDIYISLGRGNDTEVAGVAWAGSLILGFNFLSGPLTSWAANKFGFRAGSMIGSMITGVAFTIAACSADSETGVPNIPILILFYGVVSGVATALIYMPSVVCVGYYFDKKRALAVGLAISGTGCGAFVYAPFTKWLIGEVGWQGAILVQANLLFACSMIGALYRPLEQNYAGDTALDSLHKLKRRMRRAMIELYDQEEIESWEPEESFKASQSLLTSKSNLDQKSTILEQTSQVGQSDGGSEALSRRIGDSSHHVRKHQSISGIYSDKVKKSQLHTTSQSGSRISRHRQAQSRTSHGFSIHSYNPDFIIDGDENEEDDDEQGRSLGLSLVDNSVTGYGITAFENDEEPRVTVQVLSESAFNHPLVRADAYLAGSATEENTKDGMKYIYTTVKAASKMQSTESSSELKRRHPISSQHVTSPDLSISTKKSLGSEQCCSRLIRRVRSWKIVAMPSFWIIGLSGFLITLGYPIPYIYLSELATANNVDEEIASYMLSFVGMTNTLGRILCGYFGDFEQVNSLYLNNFACLVAGSVTFVLPYVAKSGLPVFIAYTVIFGGAMACFATLRSIIIRDFIGLSNLASAFGLCLSLQGAAAIMSSPIASALYNATGDYELAFIVSGCLMIAGSILSFLLPLTGKRQILLDAAEKKHTSPEN